jgi:hypothetical protein
LRGSKVCDPKLLRYVIVAIISVGFIFALLSTPVTSAVPGASHGFLSIGNPSHSHLQQGNSTAASALEVALNRHDSDAALGLFSDSATVSDLSNIACLPGPPPFCGGYNVFTARAQIRGWLEQLVRDNIAVRQIGDFNVTGNYVNWTLEVTVNEYRRLNIAPLTATAQALVHDGKIDSLTIKLTQDSTTKLALGYASNQRTPYSILASGISLGVFALGLVFPAAAIYYISKVKRLFATVPRLDKPWILLSAGVGSLLISLLLEALRDLLDLSTATTNFLFIAILSGCSFFVMSAMILMKRVMVDESID